MKKKLLLFAAAIGLFVLLTGCQGATVDSTLEFTDKSGAGTKTITFVIPQDGETVITTADELDEQGRTKYEYTIYNNSTYFPKGYQAFADFVVSKLPANGYTATVREDTQYVYIDFAYSFTSFADYAKKTKDLMGERWEKGEFVDPQLYVTKIEDTEDVNYGKYQLTFAESKHLTNACLYNLLEVGFCWEAVEQGVYAPFGDAFENPDCKDMYRDYYATNGFNNFAITYFMGVPGNVCSDSANRVYKFEDVEYEELRGGDGMISLYITEAEATTLGITVTDPMPETLGKTPTKPQTPMETDEEGNVVQYKNGDGKMEDKCIFINCIPQSNSSLIVIIIVAVVVVAAAVVVVAIIMKKRNDEYDDDDDDEDDDDEDDDDDEE